MARVFIDSNIQALQQLHANTLLADKSQINIRDFIDQQARTVHEAHRAGNRAVIFHLACWYKPLIGSTHEQIMQYAVTLDVARQSMAREYGFENWQSLESLGNTSFNTDFENCIDTLLAGEIDTLQTQLNKHPAFVNQRSQYGHRATLLHYLAANGVESYRQVTPFNAAALAQCLVNAGAQVNSQAAIYGGSAPLGLLCSSAHPANAGVTNAVAKVLQDAGATE